MRRISSIILAFIAFSVAALASVSGIKVFDSWSQVSELWNSEVNPLLLIGHPHMPRYFLAYPGLLLEERLPGIGFSFYIAAFFACNIVLFRKLAEISIWRRPSLVIYFAFIAIHFAMNGRGVIAWTAWLLCIWICCKILMKITTPTNQLLLIAFSCWFAAVSTGVFVVVMVAFLFAMLAHLRSVERMSYIKWGIILGVTLPLGYALFEYFVLAIEKNISFFGGGIQGVFNMLQHGVGEIFFELNIRSAVLYLLLYFGAILLSYSIIFRINFSLLERFVFLPLAGGFFGITVLTLVLPLLLLRIQAGRWGFLKLNRY